MLSDAAVRRSFDPELVVQTECMITTYQNVYYFADSFVDAKNKLRSASFRFIVLTHVCTHTQEEEDFA